jgi:tetratricopeptide (TPR) repeat protein
MALLAGCHSAPPAPVRAPVTSVAPTPSPLSQTSPAGAGKGPGSTAPASANGNTAGPNAGGSAPAEPVAIPPRAAQQYSQALQLMTAGRKTDAELEFKQLVVAYPQFAGPQINLGLLYRQDSRLNDAEAAFRAAVKLTPANPVASDELGIVERKLGKFTDAEAAYLNAIAAEPNYAPAHLNLGVLYDLYMAEPQKALDQYERYLEIAGENKQIAGWVVELRKRVGAPAPAAKKEPA